MEMNLFSETDNNAKNEKLKNVLCTVSDTAVATTQVHSSMMTNEQSTNIRGIIQNVTYNGETVTFNGEAVTYEA